VENYQNSLLIVQDTEKEPYLALTFSKFTVTPDTVAPKSDDEPDQATAVEHKFITLLLPAEEIA